MISSDDICEWVRKHNHKLDYAERYSNIQGPCVATNFIILRVAV